MATANDLLNVIAPFLGKRYPGANQWAQWYKKQTGETGYSDSALFCAAGLSWAFDQIGMGKQVGGPWIWTVGWFAWCQKNLTQVGSLVAQPGDICFWKFPTVGDRDKAVVNHVNTVKSNSGGYLVTRGFNEGSGGTGGWVLDCAYSKAFLVAVFRPPYGTTTPTKPTTTTTPETLADEDEENMMHGCTYMGDDGKKKYMLFNENSGFYSEFGQGNATPMPGSYVNPIAQNWGTKSWPTITASHAAAIKRDLDKVRQGK